ncbi:MAG: HipA family kinase [Verrucomicrobiales bacterium]
MSVTIVSICERAEKGISRPFFCEGDDGNFYFLKRDNISLHPLLPGAMRGDGVAGLKKQILSSPPPGRGRGKTSMKLP